MGALAALQRRVCRASVTACTEQDYGYDHLPVAATRTARPGTAQFAEQHDWPDTQHSVRCAGFTAFPDDPGCSRLAGALWTVVLHRYARHGPDRRAPAWWATVTNGIAQR